MFKFNPTAKPIPARQGPQVHPEFVKPKSPAFNFPSPKLAEEIKSSANGSTNGSANSAITPKKSIQELMLEAKERRETQAKSSSRTDAQIMGDISGKLTKALKTDDHIFDQHKIVTVVKSINDLTPNQTLRVLDKKINDDLKQPFKIDEPIPQFIKLADASPGHKPDESQQAAIDGLTKQRFGCLIGPAGSGKTFTLRQILKRIEENIPQETIVDENGKKIIKLSIRFLAFTGRAVQQMKRQLPKELHSYCGTIHGELGLKYVPKYEEYIAEGGMIKQKMIFEPTYNRGMKMPAKMFIFDEAGMIGISLWNKLAEAMSEGANFYMVGDINQLPPVYDRSILGHAMDRLPTFELAKIHRQAEDSPIIGNAHQILSGLVPKNFKGSFKIENLATDSGYACQSKFLDQIKLMHMNGLLDPFRDAIIVAYNKGNSGQDVLNSILSTYFNPVNERIAIQTGISRVNYAIGDKVMIHANDKFTGLTNGMTGRITDIKQNGAYKNNIGLSQAELNEMSKVAINKEDVIFDDDGKPDAVDAIVEEVKDSESENSASQRQSSHIVTVNFGTEIEPNQTSFATAGQFRKLSLAYVITCHKSQGGEYPTVIILAHSSQHKLLSREWLYTAVTRAQERVLICYNNKGLMGALNTQRIKGRTLKEKIASFLEASKPPAGMVDNRKDSVPLLPKPMEI